MDAVTVFGGAVLAGSVLNGLYGYWGARAAGEKFSLPKFSQTVTAGIISGAGLATAAVGTIDPTGNALITAFVGLTTGFGIDAGRGAVGLKK